MNTFRRLTSCTLVLAAASLTACADAPPTALVSSPADAVVAAANANVGSSGSVVEIGSASRSLARVLAQTTLNATGKDFVQPKPGGALHNIRPCNLRPIDTVDPIIEPIDGSDPCAPDPCTYDPSSCNPCYPSICPPPPPPPPPGPDATFTFGSDATAVGILPGTTLKTLTLSSFSQALTNVSFTTLDASFRNVGAQTSCYNTPGQFDSTHASGFGSPLYLSTSRTPAWQGIIRWQVDGTHGFSPISGASGGGTFYSSDFTCG